MKIHNMEFLAISRAIPLDANKQRPKNFFSFFHATLTIFSLYFCAAIAQVSEKNWSGWKRKKSFR